MSGIEVWERMSTAENFDPKGSYINTQIALGIIMINLLLTYPWKFSGSPCFHEYLNISLGKMYICVWD